MSEEPSLYRLPLRALTAVRLRQSRRNLCHPLLRPPILPRAHLEAHSILRGRGIQLGLERGEMTLLLALQGLALAEWPGHGLGS